MAAPSRPLVYVEVARAQGWSTETFGWTDITSYVENPEGIEISRGRKDERSTAEPARLNLTLNNADGRFTPGKSSGAYFPDIRKGLPIRVTARWPLPTGAASEGNYHPNPSVETNADGWATNTAFGAYDAHVSVVRSSTRAHDGTWSVLATAPAGTKGSWCGVAVPLVAGRTYTASCWVWVPSGDADVNLEVLFLGGSAITTTKDAWVKLTHTFTAFSTVMFVGVLQRPTVGANDLVYIDEFLIQEGTIPGGGTYNTNTPNEIPRFFGYVDDWPVNWPSGSTIQSLVPISASGVTARLAGGVTFQAVPEMEILADHPNAYYPLKEEEQESALAGDNSGNLKPSLRQRQAGSGGSLSIGSVSGPPGGDDLTAVSITRSSASAGPYLSLVNSAPLHIFLGIFNGIECCFRTSTRQDMVIAVLYVDGTPEHIRLQVDGSTGKIEMDAVLFDGVDTYFGAVPVTSNAYDDGNWHHIAAWFEKASSTTVTAKLMVDGGTVFSAGPFTRWSSGGNPIQPPWNALRIGRSDDATTLQMLTGDVAHVAVWAEYNNGFMSTSPTTRFQDHYKAAINGFTPETITNRLTRYAKWAGLPSSRVSTSATTEIGHIPTSGVQPLEAMRALERTDAGALFDTKDGKLGYESRVARYTATSSLTLNAANEDLEDDLEFRLDDQFLTNEVFAQRSDGSSTRVYDQTSIDLYGPYSESLDLAGVDDNHVLAAAQWLVTRYAEPETRLVRATTNLMTQPTSATVTSILGLDVGSRITLSSLPTQAPGTSVDYFVEGITESIGPDGWRLSFTFSPVIDGQVWLLGDTTNGVLGSTTVLAY